MDNTGGGEPNTSDTIDVLKCLRCGQEGCTNVPGWGYQGEGPTLCSEHATPVMVQTVPLCCEHGECSSRRTFGFDGSLARLCAGHKLDGMVDLMKRRSQVQYTTIRKKNVSTSVLPTTVLFWYVPACVTCHSVRPVSEAPADPSDSALTPATECHSGG